jgi:hypothetical protein
VAVSPADFELYSRATGVPYPRTPEERMRMAPEVHQYAKNYARQPSALQKVAGAVGKAAQIGGTLAGAYGIAKALGPQAGAMASAVADEVINQSKGPSGVVITDLTTPKEKHIYHRDYSGNKSGNYGERDKTYEKPSFYDEIAEHDFDSPQSDGFVEPNVRIPTRREEKPPTERHQRKTVIREGKNYGNIEPKRDLVAEADAKAAEILGSQLATREGGGQTSDLRRLDKDPRSFLSAASNALIAKTKQEVADFDAGIDWGNTLDQAASADSPVKGALILGGGVAKKGFHDAKTRIGKDINTAGNIVSEAVANVKKIPAAMQEVDSVIANEQMKASVMPDNKMQETTGNILIDQAGIAPNKTIHTGGSIQGSEPGLGAQVDSGSPQTNRRREELRETFRKSLGTVPPEKREALIDQQLEKESNSKGLSQLKNFVSKAMSSDIAQAGDQAAKKVVRGVLRTVAGEEKFQEMAAENLREQQAERMRAMAGNEARMSNIRSKYSMDYNPAAPKLAGDAIIGLNKDRFGSSAYIPTGGIDMLRDESLPASAYDVRVPREDEETPLWWDV